MSASHLTAASFQLIINNALKAYEKRTKKDLLVHPLTSQLHTCNSPATILVVLQQQVQGLYQSQNIDDRWTKWFDLTVKVLYTSSVTLEQRVGLIFSPAKFIFAGIGVLLLAAKDVLRGQDALFRVFELIESFLRRLEIHTDVPPTKEMMDTTIWIMAEILSIIGMATKEIKQGRMRKYGKKLIGMTHLEDALKRLDRLTHEEAQMATAEAQRAAQAIDERAGQVREQVSVVDVRAVSVNDEVTEVINDHPPSTNEGGQSDSFMSSTGQTTSSASNVQLIVDALTDYANITGIDLSENLFVATLKQSNSPEAVLQLLEGRMNAFKEYRDGNRRLIGCLTPVVNILQAFSGVMGKAVSLVPFPPANALFAGFDVLLAAASGVTSSYDALLDLFECLGNFLKRLEIYTTIPLTPIMTDIIVKIMVELLSVLALATKQIEQGRFKKFAKKLLGESKTERVLHRLDRLTQDEARMTGAHTLGVVHGLVGNVRLVMEDGRASTDSIRQELVSLHRVLNDMNKMKRDQLQRDVRHWLSPPDPSTNHSFVRKARLSGTAAWFFESDAITEWKETGSLLWIHGKPGAGKSTLLSAIIQDIEGMRAAGLDTMAYYYFDFRDAKKQDCYGLLSSLISQLSAESDACFNKLSQLFSDHSCRIGKPDIDTLKYCFTDMLSLPGQAPNYIVLDAVDECPNSSGTPSAREEVLELIEELVNLKLPNVYLCVASRPEMDVRAVLEPLTSLRVSLHEESGQRKDIIEYIKFFVRSDRFMRRWREEDQALVIDTLSDKADGIFRWVVCQVDSLRRAFPASIRNVLNNLPKTLDETYERTLLDIDEEKREYAQRLFQCLTVSIRPLCVEELAEILAVRFNEAAPPTFNAAWRPVNAEEAVISACCSLVSIVDRQGSLVVQFSHFSVKEFLTSERLAMAKERLSCYHILPEPAHIVLAHAGLSVLLHLDDKIDRDSISHFPLATYAARHWVDHAQFRNVSLHIRDVMERLFDPTRPHFAAWVWLYDIDRYWIEPMSEIHPIQPKAAPLYYASLCGFRDLVEYLIAAHPRDIDSKGGFHWNSLHVASIKGHVDVASLLLENGADPNFRGHGNRAPLHRVSQAGQLVMMKSSLEIARLLVNSGADLNVIDFGGDTPLHAAAKSGYRNIAELLLDYGASLNVRNKLQETPLHVACGNGKLEVSRLLIDRGSNMNLEGQNGFLPSQLASLYRHVDIVQLLLDRGFGVNKHGVNRWTSLHVASQSGCIDLVRALIDRGAYVNAHTEDRRTPLHLASSNGHLDIVKLLISHNANVDSRNGNEKTPLDDAARSGHLDIARFLLESGADVTPRDKIGWTPFHTASFCGHLDIVKFFLERFISVDIRYGNDQTPLYMVSGIGKVDVAHFLIEHGADIHVKSGQGWNSLHIASQNGHIDVVRFLIERGANIHDKCGQGSCQGWNSLHLASEMGHLDVVRILINSGIAVNIRNGTQKMTPLALASREGKVGVGRFLIEQGAEINARDKHLWTPLHIASAHGHLDMAQLLLDHGVDVNKRGYARRSPLHVASANGHLKIAKLPVQRGARVDGFYKTLETPLSLAVWNGNVAVAHFLISHGANVRFTDINNWTLLHAASHGGHLEVVKLLLRRGANVDVRNKAKKTAAELASGNGKAEVARFIAEYKANANIRNQIQSDTVRYSADELEDGEDEGKTLHDAAEEGNIEVVKSLLELGADINVKNEDSQAPLFLATTKGNLDVVRFLLERGAEVDICTNWGWTPLYEASKSGNLEISRVLIDHGADMDMQNPRHWAPLHISAANGHLEIVRLLLERGTNVNVLNDDGETPYQISLRRGYREIANLFSEHAVGRAST